MPTPKHRLVTRRHRKRTTTFDRLLNAGSSVESIGARAQSEGPLNYQTAFGNLPWLAVGHLHPTPTAPEATHAKEHAAPSVDSSMSGRLAGRVALITGGGSGVGAMTAHTLASEGAKVAVTDIDEPAAQAVAHQLTIDGFVASAHALDVADEASWIRVVAEVEATYGPVTVLHSNAAPTGASHMSRDGDVEDMDVELWDFIMAVALRGSMLGCKHLIRGMVDAGGGSIVITSSVKGQTGSSYRVAYSCSKGALDALVRMVATRYGKSNVRCNAIAPGIVETPGLRETVPPDRLQLLEDAHLVPRLGRVEDIASAVLFLASEESSFITGQIINVDGGLTAHTPALSPPGSR